MPLRLVSLLSCALLIALTGCATTAPVESPEQVRARHLGEAVAQVEALQARLTEAERRALEDRDFPGLWALDVHPVLLFHLSAVLNPREWYIQEVVPKIRDVPNAWYDYYRT